MLPHQIPNNQIVSQENNNNMSRVHNSLNKKGKHKGVWCNVQAKKKLYYDYIGVILSYDHLEG